MELLPVQAFINDRHLVERGLANYWGYNPSAYFAPAPRYLSSGRRLGIQGLRASMHDAGIEVILDVVYNHTAEGNHMGPTLSLPRHRQCVVLSADARNERYYTDFTGCGNTINQHHPRVLQMIMDSLRYWVEECMWTVSASTLQPHSTRERRISTGHSGSSMPAAGPGAFESEAHCRALGCRRGRLSARRLPAGWAEWNDRYRDSGTKLLAGR